MRPQTLGHRFSAHSMPYAEATPRRQKTVIRFLS